MITQLTPPMIPALNLLILDIEIVDVLKTLKLNGPWGSGSLLHKNHIILCLAKQYKT